MSNIENILCFCKTFYPKSILLNGKIRLTKGSGWHEPNVAYRMAIQKSFEKEVSIHLQGATDIIYSKTTKSVYYKIGDKEYRISDHINKNFTGKQILINLKTNSNE